MWSIDGEGSVTFTAPNSNVPRYGFKTVYSEEHSNYHVYQQTGGPIIQSVMGGVNGTVFAYGVTSSGKTHTMLGHATQPGLVPQAVQHLFKLIKQCPSRVFLLRLSMLEIYNEVINDLLEPANANLRLREDAHRGGFYVEGIKEVEVRPHKAAWRLCDSSSPERLLMPAVVYPHAPALDVDQSPT